MMMHGYVPARKLVTRKISNLDGSAKTATPRQIVSFESESALNFGQDLDKAYLAQNRHWTNPPALVLTGLVGVGLGFGLGKDLDKRYSLLDLERSRQIPI